MIGFFLNGIKAIGENRFLKKRLEKNEKQLNDIQSIDSFLETLENPYDIVIAKNQLLLAKFYQLRKKSTSTNQLKNEWERVKKEMFSNIQQTEEQLMKLTANKLDIARIVTSLSQISNELDIELKQNNELVEDRLNKVDHQQESVESELTKMKELVAKIQESFHSKTEELELEIYKIQESLLSLEKRMDEQILTLQEQLQNQKIEWMKRAEQLEQAIHTQAKEQKKTLLIWTVPLYVAVVGIIVGLIIF